LWQTYNVFHQPENHKQTCFVTSFPGMALSVFSFNISVWSVVTSAMPHLQIITVYWQNWTSHSYLILQNKQKMGDSWAIKV
jgi:hypothetical protein